MSCNLRCLTILVMLVHSPSQNLAQDGKESKTPRALTLLGTIKGEVSKVSEGGRKIEVKYKELVTSTRSSGSTTVRGGASSKYRPPASKELVLKEKNQELELRLLDNSIVRLLDGAKASSDSKSNSKKKTSTKSSTKKETRDDDEKKDADTTDSKPPTKNSKKPSEPALPGKAGQTTDIAKGQIVIVSVAREDLPGFSRLIATSVYILGEK